MGIYAALALGALGAAGSIGGAALSGGGGSQRTTTQTPPSRDPFSDPVTAAAAFDTLLNLGIVDPSVLASASPVQRAIQGVQRTQVGINDNQFASFVTPLIIEEVKRSGVTDPTELAYRVRENYMNDAYALIDPVEGTRLVPNDLFKTATKFIERTGQVINALRASSGLPLADLAKAQSDYEVNTTKRFGELQGLADTTLGGRIAASKTRAELLGGLQGNLQSVREGELTRLNDQYNKANEQLLRQANAAGFNPGRALGELERSRVIDAPNEALNRAIALVTGQGNLLNVLSGQPIDQSTQLGAVRAGGTVASPGATSTSQPSALGQGIAQAIPAALLSYDIARNSRGPGTSNVPNSPVGPYASGYRY